ncbi:MAG: T9SS type A sorting domain-containing protein, partial [Ignavibacteriales bacterium]|nr:T9SS type A sorting domain-containing protein [Ignavibacteriales bacterium]
VSGTSYYRLRQTDFGGAFEYSQTVEVEFVPTQYSLGQNYPNPFNPTTKIKFAVPVDAKVVVKVYNTIGQEVAEAVNGSFSAGLYEVSFNASDLTSGVYFYTIDAKGINGTTYSNVKKMILMK